MAELKQWLQSKGYFTASDKKPSHLLYDGGKIYVPPSAETEFLARYAKESELGNELFYVETRPRIFKFIVDLDITDDHFWSFDEIKSITVFIQSIVKEFYATDYSVIVATSPQKEKNGGIHTGVHLIWPKLFVDSETARIIRRGVVQKLNEDRPPPASRCWEDVVDEVIYTRNGFRMIGSDKMNKNKETGEKESEGRPLKVTSIITNGEIDYEYLERLNDYVVMALECSIRYVPDVYRSSVATGMGFKQMPSWLEEDTLEAAENKGRKSKKKCLKVDGKIVTDEIHEILEDYINTYLPAPFKGVIKAVTRYADGNLLIKTNSRYCMNLGREHNSCGIYFFANPSGLYQKCLCPCEKIEGRKFGFCRDYKSPEYKFPSNISELLFPEQYNKILLDKFNSKCYDPKMDNSKTKNSVLELQVNKLFNDIMSS